MVIDKIKIIMVIDIVLLQTKSLYTCTLYITVQIIFDKKIVDQIKKMSSN